jgi:hypothetical protein
LRILILMAKVLETLGKESSQNLKSSEYGILSLKPKPINQSQTLVFRNGGSIKQS